MGQADSHQPTIDTSNGEGAYHWRYKDFVEVLNLDFTTMSSLPSPRVEEGSDPEGKDDVFKSIGYFNGHDVLKVEPLNKDWGAKHHNNRRNADGTRDRAWYNKVYDDIYQLSNNALSLGGKVIYSSHPEYSDDYEDDRLFPDGDGGQDLYPGDVDRNFCSAWLDSYWTPPQYFTPSVPPPNLTIERNCYIELCVSFQEMRSQGHRLSLWLMPATTNNNPGTLVLQPDPGTFNETAYSDTDPLNGVEIDIFEHEYTEEIRDMLFMKAIKSLSDCDYKYTQNDYGQITDAANGISTTTSNGTEIEYDYINDGFHRIGFLWTGTEMIWFINGRPVVKDAENGNPGDTRNPQNARMYLLLTREYGQVLAGEENFENSELMSQDGDFDNDKVYVKYLKVWRANARTSPKTLPALRQPEQLHGWIDNGDVVLRWGSATGATKYNIYKDGGYVDTVVSGTTWTDTNVTSNTEYEYKVEAWDNNGNYSTRSHIAYVRV